MYVLRHGYACNTRGRKSVRADRFDLRIDREGRKILATVECVSTDARSFTVGGIFIVSYGDA